MIGKAALFIRKYTDLECLKWRAPHLRHSHASYLLSHPMISELLIADRLGHSVEMLRSTYAYIYEKSRENLVDFIDKL